MEDGLCYRVKMTGGVGGMREVIGKMESKKLMEGGWLEEKDGRNKEGMQGRLAD